MDIVNEIVDDMLCKLESEFKKCTKCEIFKLKSEFNKDKSRKGGLYNRCKNCVALEQAEHYEKNKDSIKLRIEEWRQKNKEKVYKWKAAWNQKNKESIAEYQLVYRQEHKTKRNQHSRDRYHSDDGYRILTNLRNRLNKVLKQSKKSTNTKKLVGIESGDLVKEYLALINPELKNVKCDIDHRIQCHLYDLTLEEHQKACFHYTNLQWLPAQVNRVKKGAKYPPEIQSELDDRNKFKLDSPTVQKQLALIAQIESRNLSFKQVVELQRSGQLFEVKGYM